MKKIHLFLALGLLCNAYQPVEAHTISLFNHKLTYNKKALLIAAGCCATILFMQWLSHPTTQSHTPYEQDENIDDTDDEFEEDELLHAESTHYPLPKPKFSDSLKDRETLVETESPDETQESDSDADDALIEQIRETELLETNF